MDLLHDLLWPLVVIGFVGCAFTLVVYFVRYAVTDHDAAVSGATQGTTGTQEVAAGVPPSSAAPA
jgi:hypothetical protein